jgi:hypothetical protein
MTDRLSTETAKLEFTAEKPGAEIGADYDNGNLGSRTLQDESSVCRGRFS